MPTARRLVLVVAGAFLLLAQRPRAQAAGLSALDRYARGDFAVIESLTLDGFDQVRREIKASSLSPRVKAAFLLEAFESFQRRTQLDPTEWRDPADRQYRSADPNEARRELRVAAGHVFGDAFDALGAVPPADEFVTSWFRAAAAALAHGAYEQSQTEWYWSDISIALGRFHVDKRVDPGEAALTEALPVERFGWRSVYQDRQTFVAAQQDALRRRTEKDIVPMLLNREMQAVPHALVELKKAEAFHSARAESLMRQGALLAASGHAEQALPLFDASEKLVRDDWVEYLDRLLEGRALETLDRFAPAEASYRAALTLRPKARSANLALSALLFARGTRADANLSAVFDAASDRLDPWSQLPFGAYRFWRNAATRSGSC